MKAIRKFFTFTVALLLSSQLLPAAPLTGHKVGEAIDWGADLRAQLEALATVEPVPFDSVPRNPRGQVIAAGYWSMQNPRWPALPGNPYQLPVWSLGDGIFVLDDRGFDYAALEAEAALNAELEQFLSGGAQMQMMSSSLLGYAYGNPVYLLNLAATNAGGMTAAFDIAGGTNNVPYDILTTTNLANPIASWNWLGMGYTSNRYTFTSQPANNAFYILAKPAKTMTVGMGNDAQGQCTVPPGLTNVLQVAGGLTHSLALKTDGTVVAWGGNAYGQSNVPASVSGVAMIAAGLHFNVALRTNGTVIAWGDNTYGQTNVPANLTNVAVISAQFYHALALTKSGTVVVWGLNSTFGTEATVPANLSNVTAIATGGRHHLAVSNGYVVAWGYNGFGQTNVPAGLSNVVDVAAGDNHSVALLKNGTVVAWGDNASGQASVPAGLTNVVAIAAGGDYVVNFSDYGAALKRDGTVVVWGNGKATAPVGGLDQVIGLAAGTEHLLAVRTGPATPVITVEPVSQYFLTPGGNVTFTTRGAGLYGVGYQWQTNGVNLPGATNATLTVTNVQVANTNLIYRCVVSNEAGSLVSSNVNTGVVTPPVFTFQSTPTNRIVNYGESNLLSGVATAPGETVGFPITYQWLSNGVAIPFITGSSYLYFVSGAMASTYTLIASNAAGSASIAWTLTVNANAINVTNDVLLIYNASSTNSTQLKDYYLAHRPMIAGANVLGVACDTNEVTSITSYTNQILTPVLNWLTNNPTKRPQYVIMFYEMPTRTSTYPNGSGSVGYNLRNAYPGWQPYVNNLNAGTLADCKAYVDKIKFFGTNYSPGQLVISASAGGYGNTNYLVDDIRYSGDSGSYVSSRVVANATNGLLNSGVSNLQIRYATGIEDSAYFPHLTNAVNVAGYVCWGVHSTLAGDYAVDGKVKWSGNSRWWIIETVESFNGVRDSNHGNFVKWFSSNAFGGTNYSCTPVGAVVHVEEPSLSGVEDSAVYFGLWASGKNFASCAWAARKTEFFEAVGDPFVTK